MANRSGVFIFTKDREEMVSTLIKELIPYGYPIFVIDDSTNRNTRCNIASLSTRANIYYNGLEQQTRLIRTVNSDESSFLKVLGNNEWNLGFARNHALLLASWSGLDNALFLDDDISINETSTLNDIFSALDRYQLVGSKIVGMPDDSILGHVASKFNIHHQKLYSGGCLGFKVSLVTEHFLNIYNEDWIWQYMQSAPTHAWIGEVHHKFFYPFNQWQARIIFQELGELLVDALEDAKESNKMAASTDLEFWNQQIIDRKDYLVKLRDYCESFGTKEFADMISFLLKHYPLDAGQWCKQIFEKYLTQRNLFQEAKLKLSALGSQLVI